MEYDHDFLNGKFIETNKGVTYDLIDPSAAAKTNDNNPNNDNKGVDNEKKNNDINEERVIDYLLINDVVTEPRMKFFREPHLGSYLALDLNYETSMSYNSLVSAITEKNEEEKSKQEERYKESNDEEEEIKK